MNRAENALFEIQEMNYLAGLDSPIHRLAPLAKLLVTIGYIAAVISFSPYDLTGLLPMILYPVIAYQISEIPISTCFYKLRVILPLVCAVGLFNPLLDRDPVLRIGVLTVTTGMISMITLMMKGVYCLMASFLLITTTRIEEICHALRQIHVPKILTSLMLLTYRYISLLLEEVSIMTTAYHLRAPGQNGIHYTAWGSFLGQLILRTMDRATTIYESMELRGYHGEFFYIQKKHDRKSAFIYAMIWLAIFLLLRTVRITELLGHALLR